VKCGRKMDNERLLAIYWVMSALGGVIRIWSRFTLVGMDDIHIHII
jgi:hypothetical protein